MVKDAHPAIISRSLFADAKKRREAKKSGFGLPTYRNGRGAKSPYLLSGLIHCQHCGQNWQGYTTTKSRRKNDGSAVKCYYYACGGYVTKGNAVCKRSVLDKEVIEEWVMEEIGQIVQDYLGTGGEDLLRQMLEQEVARGEEVEGVGSADLKQRKVEIEAAIENLLDNLTPTNRDFVDRKIQKLRVELAELEQQEAVLEEHKDRARRVAVMVLEALRQARQFVQVSKEGTIDEKRTLIRAFVKSIDFDPETRTGTAYFWMVPPVGQDDEVDGGRGTRFITEDANLASDAPESAHDENASLPLRLVGTRFQAKRPAGQADRSSLIMVAGAGFEPATSGL